MALGIDYARQDCSLARALELVGERWTMLIVRDCFFGIRRFGDFLVHLDISKAVLTQRLGALVDAGILEKRARTAEGGHDDYVPTAALEGLWPALFALTYWGEEQTAKPEGRRRRFLHAPCGTDLGPLGLCPECGVAPGPQDIDTDIGPGYDPDTRSDEVSMQLRTRRRLLEPLR
ncbi:helix-turn-helix domain-containing protein [Rhodococcus sp. KRD162]|uniref:winged helix-turn-helix transcriptional regulator n=1 Tax=unclassified Rhodococcus (in: high G+C Gram-positive bacteria) TaxID=192944 RepID=UPI0019D1A68D|nr:helix-turn-helix domain-containing protein [Rhodococcus sp. KRD162]